MDQSTVRRVVRAKLRDQRLPINSIPRVWGGAGAGEECDACEEIITKDQFILEGVSVAKSGQSIQFHVRCFHVWDEERRMPDLIR